MPAFVSAWKERGLRALAGEAADVIANTVAAPAVAAIAFVPPDGDRSLKRGHHPAEWLARELGRRWDVPVVTALGRTRSPRPQRGLSLAARRRNVARAFVATASMSPPRIALVDDVYTTGSTASAAASALRRAGARRVEVVTFARTVRSLESTHRS